MMQPAQKDILNLSGKDWKSVPRLSRVIPFGYKVSETDSKMLEPDVFQLEALEQAKKHLKKGYSYRIVSRWLSDVTGRTISHMGLHKRVEYDRSRGNKAKTLKKWAEVYKDAYQKAKAHEDKLGKSTFDLEDALDPDSPIPARN
ncbi:MAG: hypothetical protein IM509_05240 [Microcystis sp. M31BS1]|jgi:hypothetical protein|uniref:hypothetical protein n=1 Tax=Microcystis sp. M31BS1 TaxID=2771186 RepID=UPI00258B7C7E|nr:hypothetical protein [Microcystis sp. M31BS1]MCA2590155.1 hypothetical protein [Microcystis sp. M31BS1]